MYATFYQLVVSAVIIFIRTISAVTNLVTFMQKFIAKIILLAALLHIGTIKS